MRILIYHVAPLQSAREIWQDNLAQLSQYLGIFDRVHLAVITGENMAPAAEVLPYFSAAENLDVEEFADGPYLENATFIPLLRKARQGNDKHAITFYAHTKGVTRPRCRPIAMWYRAMLHFNLHNPQQIDRILLGEGRPCTGIYRFSGQAPHFPAYSQWHYSGNYFWVRNAELFSRPNWDQDFTLAPYPCFSCESYLSRWFSPAEASCHFLDGYFGKQRFWRTPYMDSAWEELLLMNPTLQAVLPGIEHLQRDSGVYITAPADSRAVRQARSPVRSPARTTRAVRAGRVVRTALVVRTPRVTAAKDNSRQARRERVQKISQRINKTRRRQP